ncbi:MAG: hypothetical protein ACYTGC_03350, partial [Planctomycetota bacterium]
LNALDEMRTDRRLLRQAGTPSLPRDFVAELEPMLARPMLMESRPGAYRRRHQRRRSVRQVALAASVLLAVSAGLLGALSLWTGGESAGPQANDDTGRRSQPAASADREALATDVETDAWPAPDATVHHHLPGRIEDGPLRYVAVAPRDALATTDEPAAEARRRDATLVSLPFALQIEATDVDLAEDAMVDLLGGHERRLTLVRNFSFDEARQMEPSLPRPRGGRRPSAPLAADLDAHGEPVSAADRRRTDKLIRDIISRFDRGGDRGNIDRRSGVATLGSRQQAAPVSQQMIYAEHGAQHTLSVRVSELNEVLQLLAMLPGARSGLAMMPEMPEDPSEVAWNGAEAMSLDEARWVTDRATIRRRLAELQQADPDATVLLPVMIQAAEGD